MNRPRVFGVKSKALTRLVQRAWSGNRDNPERVGVCLRLWPTHRSVLIFPFGIDRKS
jgi:hypothetical protein